MVGWAWTRFLMWLATAAAQEAVAFGLALIVPIFLGISVFLYFVAPDEPGLIGPVIATPSSVVAAFAPRR
jgi:competence protein ComEC